MGKVVVVIPVYKSRLNSFEEISLKRCCQVLGSFEIVFATFRELEVKAYKEITGRVGFKFFDKSYFADIDGYNRLLTSSLFYKAFKKFEYILIYQLDCFVFRNDLEYWCSRNWDYIGAPWFSNFHGEIDSESLPVAVGNGGFSLRKVKSSLRVIQSFKHEGFMEVYSKFSFKGKVRYLIDYLKLKLDLFDRVNCAGFSQEVNSFIKPIPFHEDLFFTQEYGQKLGWFEIAKIEEAIQFSFECHPSLLYKINGNKLPFGCHAWQKYEPEFWKAFIE